MRVQRQASSLAMYYPPKSSISYQNRLQDKLREASWNWDVRRQQGRSLGLCWEGPGWDLEAIQGRLTYIIKCRTNYLYKKNHCSLFSVFCRIQEEPYNYLRKPEGLSCLPARLWHDGARPSWISGIQHLLEPSETTSPVAYRQRNTSFLCSVWWIQILIFIKKKAEHTK